MPYQVSMMGWVGLGRVKTFVGWVGSRNFGLGFEKVTHDQLVMLQEMSVDHFWRRSQCSYRYRTLTLYYRCNTSCSQKSPHNFSITTLPTSWRASPINCWTALYTLSLCSCTANWASLSGALYTILIDWSMDRLIDQSIDWLTRNTLRAETYTKADSYDLWPLLIFETVSPTLYTLISTSSVVLFSS